ncbi:glutamate-rich protein 1 isoform X2 [Sphaerodactylus townsendi]|uniref:glutamate-rich protein 1 isoform X2 n=1 Tax=Sphaerodactylus townsendi TaxID=933632 RepID=UPI002025C1D9|nr:glutamate-rich protein 1 isoform X2 [Sphaerodactylus townsendi]
MALSRRAAEFRRKVLEKLFPASPPGVAISNTEERSVLQCPVTEQAGSTKASEGYPCLPEEHYQGQPMKKRIRRKKQKTILQNTDNSHEDQVGYGKPENPTEDNLQLPHADSQDLSRNKRRKMKKKRQRTRMKAAGLLTKPTGIDFTYKPEKEEGMNFEDVDKKGDEVLDFLQATQEIYFSDKRSKCEAPSMSSESIYESLQNLESHSMAASDVTLLHRMKSLVLLQDVERLKSATEEFQMHSAVPPDHAKAISLLFLYWITDILPGKNRK